VIKIDEIIFIKNNPARISQSGPSAFNLVKGKSYAAGVWLL